MFLKKSFILLFSVPLFLLLLNGCSQIDTPDNSETDTTLQSEPDAGGARSCKECTDGCILGYGFRLENIDGNHPQGGYKIGLVKGDCECRETSNGKWSATSHGSNYTISFGQVGGPGSGSMGSLTAHAWDVWRFDCGSCNGLNGGPIGSWDNWLNEVQTVLQAPDGPTNVNVVSWPTDWDVTVYNAPNEHIMVYLPGEKQYYSLAEIRVVQSLTGEQVASIEGNNSPNYDLDLSELPNGSYDFVLQFEQGFSLTTPMIKN